MKTLLIVRHAKSSWKDKDLPDKDRPLKKRGIHEAEYLGHVLLENELVPQLILTSHAVRAFDTAEIIGKICKCKKSITKVKEFYMAEPDAYFQELKELPDTVERVMVVGFNPGLEALLQIMDGKVDSLPTGSLAYLVLGIHSWAELDREISGDLVGFWRMIEEEPKAGSKAKEKSEGPEKHPKKDGKEVASPSATTTETPKKGETPMGDKKEKKGKKDKKDKKEKKGKKDKK